jgi:hypothetical protein
VHLIWSQYYSNGRISSQTPKGSLWWKGLLRLLTQYKGFGHGVSRIREYNPFWKDIWNDRILEHTFPELYSFVISKDITLFSAKNQESFQDLFNIPLSEEAFTQLCEHDVSVQSLPHNDEPDKWTYLWGNGNFSAKKCYNLVIGSQPIHPAIKWLWKSYCQAKHKVFYWLLLHDRLNTRALLRRKNMALDSYTCELCILQREEKLRHLFYRCSLAKQCWQQIGVSVPTWLRPQRATCYIKRRLRVSFSMEIIILICWSIWTERNRWIFNNEDPSIQQCMTTFKKEFTLLWHRVKEDQIRAMQSYGCCLYLSSF